MNVLLNLIKAAGEPDLTCGHGFADSRPVITIVGYLPVAVGQESGFSSGQRLWLRVSESGLPLLGLEWAGVAPEHLVA